MKNTAWLRDGVLLSLAVPFGFLLKWALISQRLDDVLAVLVVAVPVLILMISLVVSLAKWSRIEMDEY